MSSIIGHTLKLSLFGESHGPAVGVVIDGLAPGIPLDLEHIRAQLDKRSPKGRISTARQEPDDLEILSGYFNGYTTGTPLCLIIHNQSQASRDYEAIRNLPRPSHADYTAREKYLGYEDYRGGGHFSGRITAPLVAAGAICLQILKRRGILVGTHIAQLADIKDSPFPETKLDAAIQELDSKYFPVLDEARGELMRQAIEQAAAQGDSLGGILETAVVHMPPGIGEPFFHSVESELSALLFSIPAIKGVAFGLGFEFAELSGSQANDPFYFEGTAIKTRTNHNGGINGGITNGMPLVIRCVVKPTPSIYQAQETVDMKSRENSTLTINGRHDPAIIHRARVVVDSMVAFGLVDLFARRYGYLWMGGDPMRYGLIGGKLGHSYSKPIHEALGGYPYELIELSDSQFDPFMRQKDFSAINITIPYKQRVMAYCDTIDPAAMIIGAVNTIVNRQGKLWGYNTDYAGLIDALARHRVNLKDKKVMILGSGGTCQTIKAVARYQGARQIIVVSRNPGPGVITYAQSVNEAGVEVILNASPVGMYPDMDGQPIDLADHPQCLAVGDMIYNPLRTRLLQQAEALDIPCFNGLRMLVAQAKAASEIFTGCTIDDGQIEKIYRHLRDSLTNIVLIGMPSAGKTAIGSLLASRFTKPLVDLDDCIRQRAGMDIPGIFVKYGEEYFRGLEADCVRDVSGKTGQIIATGGGVIKDAANIASLKQNGLLFFIDRSPDRLISDDTRPLSPSPQAVNALYQQRYPLYQAYADITVDNNGTPDATADGIKEKYDELIGD